MMICSQCATKLRTPVTNELESLPEATSKRIKDLLASNVAPPERERESLSDLMSRTQNYATSLETRIAELRATLEHLLYEKSTTEQRLRDLKTALHPIRVVPPEIFAQIFDEAVSDAALIPLEKVREGKSANSIDSSQSCVVSQVSSVWRRTALKTQRLWRFVHVSFDRYPRNLSTSIFLNRFLTRSAEHMLHVMLHATVEHPAMTVLLMTSSRWKTAAVSLPPSLYHSWDAPDLAFHSLTRCHMHVQVDGLQNWLEVPLQNANDTNSLVALLRTTPRLGQLVLRARTCFDISHTIHSVLVDEKDLLPDLADLAITSMDPDGVEVSDAFVEAIQHRRSGAAQVVKLQEVSVDFVANIDADVVAAFNGLLSDGLRGALTFRCSGMDHTVDMYLG
ncbi:hypothetical protein BDZ89DRAFT_1130973 [Hymenopellis radicata]|nr:hypothetical protein BDZ89DRAFT_1130973 [Hymenopellis radicata]